VRSLAQASPVASQWPGWNQINGIWRETTLLFTICLIKWNWNCRDINLFPMEIILIWSLWYRAALESFLRLQIFLGWPFEYLMDAFLQHPAAHGRVWEQCHYLSHTADEDRGMIENQGRRDVFHSNKTLLKLLIDFHCFLYPWSFTGITFNVS
jgi:hypothetical protein